MRARNRGRSAAKVAVRVERLEHAAGLGLPAYQTPGAAGMDLVAAVPARKPLIIKRGKWALVPTGLSIELPPGTEAQVRPRSGLANRHGVTVLNSPGTIDSDYRGEVQVILINLGPKPFRVERGERIAQLVIQPVTQASLVEAKSLRPTGRGTRGFGSTGMTSRATVKKSTVAPQQRATAKRGTGKRSQKAKQRL